MIYKKKQKLIGFVVYFLSTMNVLPKTKLNIVFGAMTIGKPGIFLKILFTIFILCANVKFTKEWK